MSMADVELKTQLTLGGDAEYKSALKGINDELKIAKSGMAAATSAFARNDKSVKANATRQEELAKVFEKQKAKVDLMQAEYDKLSKAEGENSADAQKLKIALNNATVQMNKTQLQMKELDEATEEEAKDTKEASKETGEFAKKLKSAGVAAGKATFKAVAASIAAVGAAAAATVKSLAGFSKETAAYVDDIQTMSMQTGVSVDQLQKFKYAEDLIDVSTDTMTGAMAKLTKQMSAAKNGSKGTQENFKKLGVSFKDSNGHLRDSEDVFYDAIDALGKIQNETERDAMAMEIFGKSAQELNPLIKSGSGALRAYGDEAERTGFVMSDSMIAAASDYADAQARMGSASLALKNVLGATLAPTFSEITQRATHMMTKVTTALSDGLQPGELDELIASLQNEFGHMFNRILIKAKKFMPIFTGLLTTVMTTLVTNMPGYIETLLPAVTGLLQSLLDSLVAEAGPLATLASTLLTDLASFIATNLPTVTAAAGTIFETITTKLTESLPELIPLAIQMIAKLAQQLIKALPILIGMLPKIATAIVDGIKNVDWKKLGTDLMTSFKDALKTASENLGSAIVKIFQTLWDGIKAVFGIGSEGNDEAQDSGESVGAQILDGLVKGLQGAVKGALSLIKTIFEGIWNGIKSALGLGGGSDDDEADESVTLAESAGSSILEGLISGFTNGVEAVIETVKKIFGRIWDAIKSIFGFGSEQKEKKETKNDAKEAGGDIMTGVSDGITGSEQKTKKAASNASKHVIESMNKELGNENGTSSKGKLVGKYLALGMRDGINDNSDKISKAAKEAARDAYKAAKKELGIQSPSRVMMQVGDFYDQGFALGISKNATKVLEAAQDLAAQSAAPSGGKTAVIAGAAASAGNSGGNVVNLNTTYSGPFTANDAGVFGQTLARSIRGMAAVLG